MDWLFKKKGKQKKIVFSIDENNLFVAGILDNKLLFSDQMLLESVNSSTISAAVGRLAEKHQLIGIPSILVLPDSRYQLLMTDKLSVSDEEMTNAVRWKMKGLLDYPIAEAALDTFCVPSHGTGEKRNTVFVVATEKAFIQSCFDAFEKALVPLTGIDISLMALRNLVINNGNSKNRTQLLISFSNLQYSLTVINNNNIYLVRKPNIAKLSRENTFDEYLFEAILLEIQRSIDYCLSELKLASPSEVIFSPNFLSQKNLLEYLDKNLSQTVSCLDLNKIITFDREIPSKLQQSLFLSIGGGLQSNFIAS